MGKHTLEWVVSRSFMWCFYGQTMCICQFEEKEKRNNWPNKITLFKHKQHSDMDFSSIIRVISYNNIDFVNKFELIIIVLCVRNNMAILINQKSRPRKQIYVLKKSHFEWIYSRIYFCFVSDRNSTVKRKPCFYYYIHINCSRIVRAGQTALIFGIIHSIVPYYSPCL